MEKPGLMRANGSHITAKVAVMKIRCNEGPPQIVPAFIVPPSKDLLVPGSAGPMRIMHSAMIPVLDVDREACGRHQWKGEASEDGKPTCGNCRFGIAQDMPVDGSVPVE